MLYELDTLVFQAYPPSVLTSSGDEKVMPGKPLEAWPEGILSRPEAAALNCGCWFGVVDALL